MLFIHTLFAFQQPIRFARVGSAHLQQTFCSVAQVRFTTETKSYPSYTTHDHLKRSAEKANITNDARTFYGKKAFGYFIIPGDDRTQPGVLVQFDRKTSKWEIPNASTEGYASPIDQLLQQFSHDTNGVGLSSLVKSVEAYVQEGPLQHGNKNIGRSRMIYAFMLDPKMRNQQIPHCEASAKIGHHLIGLESILTPLAARMYKNNNGMLKVPNEAMRLHLEKMVS